MTSKTLGRSWTRIWVGAIAIAVVGSAIVPRALAQNEGDSSEAVEVLQGQGR